MAENALVAAESMGLGGLFVGGIRNNPQGVTDLLDLPQHVIPLFGMCIGVPDQDPTLRPRLPSALPRVELAVKASASPPAAWVSSDACAVGSELAEGAASALPELETKPELRGKPVIYGVDFGHTTPHTTFPLGGVAKLQASKNRSAIDILRH